MYSLNVPLPSSVTSLAGRLARELPLATPRARGEHTLVVKRLGEGDRAAYARLESRTREAVRGQPPFEARITGIGQFETAATGPSPVVYLAVESPALVALHERLCETFDPVSGIEGEAYTPHVTIARGGESATARRLVERDIEPVTWAVEELVWYDGERGQPVSRLSLPA